MRLQTRGLKILTKTTSTMTSMTISKKKLQVSMSLKTTNMALNFWSRIREPISATTSAVARMTMTMTETMTETMTSAMTTKIKESSHRLN